MVLFFTDASLKLQHVYGLSFGLIFDSRLGYGLTGVLQV